MKRFVFDEKESIISVKGLHKHFNGSHILKGIDFVVKPGELISIIGRSGCGKTTFLRCLNCLEVPDSGRLRVAGININRGVIDEKRRFQAKKMMSKLKMTNGRKKSDNSIIDEDFQLKLHYLRTRVGNVF